MIAISPGNSFPGGSPLSATIPFANNDSLTIVGVIDQPRLYDLHQDGRPQMSIRAEDWSPYTPYFVIRTDKDPEAMIPEIPAVVRTMDEIVTDALRQQRIGAVLIAGFALGALLLVAMGLFGVVSGSVARRRGELAVRLALGSTHRDALRLVIREGARLIGIGMLIGLPGVYMSGQLLQGLLITPFDVPTLISVGIGLLSIALLSCYLAARHVTRIDPAGMLGKMHKQRYMWVKGPPRFCSSPKI